MYDSCLLSSCISLFMMKNFLHIFILFIDDKTTLLIIRSCEPLSDGFYFSTGTLTYSCFTQDGKHYVDGCLYYSSGDEPIDVESVTVGCCIHTNTTDFWLTCATFGFHCSSGTFARVYPDVNATPPSRPTTTRAPSTPTTTKPQWYYRRTTTTRYQRNTRTTTHYRSYHRPTTAYSYRSRYRRTTTYRSTYSSSNVEWVHQTTTETKHMKYISNDWYCTSGCLCIWLMTIISKAYNFFK